MSKKILTQLNFDLLGGQSEKIDTSNIVFTEEDAGDGYRRVHIVLPGEPLSKQSVRHSVNRYYQDGTHYCPFCNQSSTHKKGDVVTYKNKTSGCVDVVTQMYQDTKYEKKKTEYLWMLKSKKCTFKAFEEEVHIERLHFVFPPLSATPKYKLEAMNAGHVFYKTTRCDIDNACKFLWDFMIGFIYVDDSIIVSMNDVCKYFGNVPKVDIILRGK